MSNQDFTFRNLINLGVFSRILLVLVKPLALWLSIRLDSDSGLAIAQIYLIGLLFLSLSGTNAHRIFFQNYFSDGKLNHTITTARSYLDYIKKITLQLVFVIFFSSLIAVLIFSDNLDVVMMGILFGIAEKLNDEYQRYVQFVNNSKNLFYLSLSKIIPVMVAAQLSFLGFVDIRIAFPILLLIGSIFINWKLISYSVLYIFKTARKSFFGMIRMSYVHIRNDILQIGCVFMGITLISFDKWLLQYLSQENLPLYMLFTQIASLFVITQTILIIAPIRARLVNENPKEIKSVKLGSPLISSIPLLIGIVLYLSSDTSNEAGDIGYFAFFFASIVTFTVAYTERLYWVASSGVRLVLDATIVFVFLFVTLILILYWPSSFILFISMALLFFLMCIRVLIMMHMLSKTSMHNK